MTIPTCPAGFALIGHTCLGACPFGTAPGSVEVDKCIAIIACPAGTVDDISGLACLKTGTGITAKTDEQCPIGFTEWTLGRCFQDCNPIFLENATECRRRYVPRVTAIAICQGSFSFFSNGSCVTDWRALLLVISFLLAAGGLAAWQIMRRRFA